MARETLVVTDLVTPLDLLLFRRLNREVPGLVEATLALNPGLAALGPYPPPGTAILVDIPAAPARVAAPAIVSLYD